MDSSAWTLFTNHNQGGVNDGNIFFNGQSNNTTVNGTRTTPGNTQVPSTTFDVTIGSQTENYVFDSESADTVGAAIAADFSVATYDSSTNELVFDTAQDVTITTPVNPGTFTITEN